ncbi:MAG: MFS transporter [Nitrososphaeria archaeon]
MMRFKAFRYHWAVLILCYITQVVYVYSIQSLPPLLSIIGRQFNLSGTDLGMLLSVYSISGAVLAVPVGLAIDRYGFYLMGTLAMILVGISNVVVAFADTFLLLLFGRTLLGVAGVLMTIGLPTIISQRYSHEELGEAMGIFTTTFACSTIITYSLVVLLAQSRGWQFPFFLGFIISILNAVVYKLTVRRRPDIEDDPTDDKGLRKVLKNIGMWKVGMVFLFSTAVGSAFLSWAPTLFQNFKGADPLYASLLASIFTYSNIFSMPIVGFLSDKFRKRKPFLFLGQLLLVPVLISMAYATGFILPFSILLFGIISSAVMPIVYAVAGESQSKKRAGVGYGIMTFCQNVGIVLSALSVGYIVDVTNSFLITCIGLALLALVGALFALTLKID